MADFTTGYGAKGILSVSDMELVEITKKEGTKVHDLEAALKRFDGQNISIQISVKEEIPPKETEGSEE